MMNQSDARRPLPDNRHDRRGRYRLASPRLASPRLASPRLARVASAVAGGVLIVAAGLKLAAGSPDSATAGGWVGSSAVQSVAVVWELALGLWLLSGVARPLAWLLAVATFGTFAGLSLSAGAAGHASCGCLGAVETNPWIMSAVDVAVLMLLIVGRPSRGEWTRAAGSTNVRWAAAGLATAALVAGLGVAWAGSPDAALAQLRGDTLVVGTPSLDLGTGRVGDRLDATAVVWNYSSDPVHLVGGTADCTCVATAGLPLMIPPGGRGEVPVTLTIPTSTPGRLDRVLTLYTDRPSKPQLRLRAGCRVGE